MFREILEKIKPEMANKKQSFAQLTRKTKTDKNGKFSNFFSQKHLF